jgi:transcriptional antiterminator RfaH
MNRWYIVHTQPNGEERARHNLQRQGFGVYLPKYLKHRRHARRVEHVRRPLFPRYLFVRFDLERDQWRSINGTFGVAYLVANGNEPVPVPNNVVDAIQARHDDDELVVLHEPESFELGQKLEIVDGPFAWHTGLFQRLSDADRVVLLLDLLGRQVTVTVPPAAIAAA